MQDEIITQTRLTWRIAAEAPTLDLESDLWTCTALDGQPIIAPTETECGRLRSRYEMAKGLRPNPFSQAFWDADPRTIEQRHYDAYSNAQDSEQV